MNVIFNYYFWSFLLVTDAQFYSTSWGFLLLLFIWCLSAFSTQMSGDQSLAVCLFLKSKAQKPPCVQVGKIELSGLKMVISLKEYQTS